MSMEWKHVPHDVRANIYLRLGMVCGQRAKEVAESGQDPVEAGAVYAAVESAVAALQDIAFEPFPEELEP